MLYLMKQMKHAYWVRLCVRCSTGNYLCYRQQKPDQGINESLNSQILGSRQHRRSIVILIMVNDHNRHTIISCGHSIVISCSQNQHHVMSTVVAHVRNIVTALHLHLQDRTDDGRLINSVDIKILGSSVCIEKQLSVY